MCVKGILLSYVCSCAILNASTVERAVESCPRKGGDWYRKLRVFDIRRCVYRADYIRETIKEKTPPCVYQTLAGKSRSLWGRPLGSALLYLYSNICAPHRQDCCAFFAYETALCDRKDTQSRFAVNAARSIVCVGTHL